MKESPGNIVKNLNHAPGVKITMDVATLEMFDLTLVNYLSVPVSAHNQLAKSLNERIYSFLCAQKHFEHEEFNVSAKELQMLASAITAELGCHPNTFEHLFWGEAANVVYQYNLLLRVVDDFEKTSGKKLNQIRQRCERTIQYLQKRYPDIPVAGRRLVF